MQCNCMMGVFPEISRAWLTIDSDIFMWSYEDGYVENAFLMLFIDIVPEVSNCSSGRLFTRSIEVHCSVQLTLIPFRFY